MANLGTQYEDWNQYQIPKSSDKDGEKDPGLLAMISSVASTLFGNSQGNNSLLSKNPTKQIQNAVAPRFEPQSTFPEVMQQNYTTPYGIKPNVAPFRYGVDPSKNMNYQNYSMQHDPVKLNNSLWE